MGIEEAIDILENIIDDEVIGIYCMEIQKRGVNCDENCKDKDCYLSEAIRTIINYIDKLKKDLENLKEVERQICCEELITKDKYQDILKENAEFKKVVWEQKADMNKLINYIAVRENKTYEEVCKELEV